MGWVFGFFGDFLLCFKERGRSLFLFFNEKVKVRYLREREVRFPITGTAGFTAGLEPLDGE